MPKIIEIPNEHLFEGVRDLIQQGHTVTIRVKGGSMMPLLHDGRDSVVLAPCTKPRRGLVVLAEISPGNYVLHRIIHIDENRITLMGDGNLSGVERCTTANIIGVAIKIIRNEKEIPLKGRWWNIYSSFWLHLLPIRRILLSIYRRSYNLSKSKTSSE